MTNTSLRPATPGTEVPARRKRARWAWPIAAALAALGAGSAAYALMAQPKHAAGPSDGGFAFDVGTVRPVAVELREKVGSAGVRVPLS